jgi:uncharacterized integral membrane protein
MAATPPLRSATNGHPSRVHSPYLAPRERQADGDRPTPSPTRAGRTWFALCTAVVVLGTLSVFMLQNTEPVLVSFLGMQGSVPLALGLLVAGMGGIVVTLAASTVRTGRRRRRRSRSA